MSVFFKEAYPVEYYRDGNFSAQQGVRDVHIVLVESAAVRYLAHGVGVRWQSHTGCRA